MGPHPPLGKMLTCFLRKSGVSTVFIRFRDSEHHAWLQPQVCRSQGIITRPFLSSFSFFTIHTFVLIIIISDFFFTAQMGGHNYNNVLQLSTTKYKSHKVLCSHIFKGASLPINDTALSGNVDTVRAGWITGDTELCVEVWTQWMVWIRGDAALSVVVWAQSEQVE